MQQWKKHTKQGPTLPHTLCYMPPARSSSYLRQSKLPAGNLFNSAHCKSTRPLGSPASASITAITACFTEPTAAALKQTQLQQLQGTHLH
jgi:hypothetical protein